MATKARQLSDAVRTYLQWHGWFVWRGGSARLPKGHIIGQQGAPDLNAVKNGRYLGIEIKVGKDRLSIEQDAFHAMLRDKGCLVLVVKSIEDIIAAVPGSGDVAREQR
jgi:Holliday junction resolvase